MLHKMIKKVEFIVVENLPEFDLKSVTAQTGLTEDKVASLILANYGVEKAKQLFGEATTWDIEELASMSEADIDKFIDSNFSIAFDESELFGDEESGREATAHFVDNKDYSKSDEDYRMDKLLAKLEAGKINDVDFEAEITSMMLAAQSATTSSELKASVANEDAIFWEV